MYHRDACESADDLIIDLMDYCYRKLTALIARLKWFNVFLSFHGYFEERLILSENLRGIVLRDS